MSHAHSIILPGDPGFYETLGNLPPNWGQVAANTSGDFSLIARAGTGILEAVSTQEVEEYLWGGEYDERLLEMGDDDDEIFS